jgi:hypothetical protein
VGREDEIRLIAYTIWEQEECPNGKDCEHWFRAEAFWEEQQKSLKGVLITPPPKRLELLSPPRKKSTRARHNKK